VQAARTPSQAVELFIEKEMKVEKESKSKLRASVAAM
jgi:hypothetical protein